MAHKTLIGGTAYEIGGGRTLVDGTGYSIDKGRTKVGGTGYDISFGTPIGSLAVGTSVFFDVDGAPWEFIVVHQGNPDSTVYDEICDGTWLLMKNIYELRNFDISYNDYRDSDTHSYLNGAFLGRLDSNIQSAVKSAKIPYTNGNGDVGSLATGSNGLSTKMFLLSYTEVGFRGSHFANVEGSVLDYFDTDLSGVRVGYWNGMAYPWWLRSPSTSGSAHIWYVSNDNSSGRSAYNSTFGIRPAFIMPSDFDVTNYLA